MDIFDSMVVSRREDPSPTRTIACGPRHNIALTTRGLLVPGHKENVFLFRTITPQLELSDLLGDTTDLEGERQRQQQQPRSSSIVVDAAGAAVIAADVARSLQSCADTMENTETMPMNSAPHLSSSVSNPTDWTG